MLDTTGSATLSPPSSGSCSSFKRNSWKMMKMNWWSSHNHCQWHPSPGSLKDAEDPYDDPNEYLFLNNLLYVVQDPNVGDALRVVQVLGFNTCDHLDFDYTVKITDIVNWWCYCKLLITVWSSNHWVAESLVNLHFLQIIKFHSCRCWLIRV